MSAHKNQYRVLVLMPAEAIYLQFLSCSSLIFPHLFGFSPLRVT